MYILGVLSHFTKNKVLKVNEQTNNASSTTYVGLSKKGYDLVVILTSERPMRT